MRFKWLLVILSASLVIGFSDADPTYTDNGISPSSPQNYSSSLSVEHSISWASASGIDKVFLEHNITGALQNQTVSLESGSYKIALRPGVGIYSYKWHANDTLNAWNSTPLLYYSVTKGLPEVAITFDGSSTDDDFNKGEKVTVAAQSQSDVSMSIIFISNSSQSVLKSGTGYVEYTLDTALYSLGKYNVTVNSSSNANYTAGNTTKTLEIEDDEKPEIDISLSDRNVTVGGNVTLTYDVTDNDAFAWIAVNISNPNSVVTSYNLTSASGSIDYSNTSIAGIYNIKVLAKDAFGNSATASDVFRATRTVAPGTFTIPAGSSAVVTTDRTTPIVSVSLRASSDVTGRLIVRRASVPGILPEGVAYSFIEILPDGFPSSSIASAQITFEVPADWIADNNVTPSSISLYSLNSTWQKISTTKTSSINGTETYSASAPLSTMYAIVGQRPLPPVVTEESEETGGFVLSGRLVAAIVVIAIIPVIVLIFLKRRIIMAFFGGLGNTAKMNYRKITGPSHKKVTKKLTKLQDQMWALRSEGKNIDDIKLNIDQSAIALKSGDFEAADYYLFEAAKLLKIRKAKLFGL